MSASRAQERTPHPRTPRYPLEVRTESHGTNVRPPRPQRLSRRLPGRHAQPLTVRERPPARAPRRAQGGVARAEEGKTAGIRRGAPRPDRTPGAFARLRPATGEGGVGLKRGGEHRLAGRLERLLAGRNERAVNDVANATRPRLIPYKGDRRRDRSLGPGPRLAPDDSEMPGGFIPFDNEPGMRPRPGAVPRVAAQVLLRHVKAPSRGVNPRAVEPFPEVTEGKKKPECYVGGICAQWSSRADRVSCAAPAVPHPDSTPSRPGPCKRWMRAIERTEPFSASGTSKAPSRAV